MYQKEGGKKNMPKMILVDTQLIKDAESVLNDIGIDVDTVVKMALKRIIRDQSISFLSAVPEAPAPGQSEPTQKLDNRITKNQAISLFTAQGFRLSRNVTFSSKNRSAYNYWANPYFFALDSDWHLILNDWIRHELHLFTIPACTLAHDQMVPRFDQQDKIDLQICYNDPTFTDNRSKISFAKFHLKSIRY